MPKQPTAKERKKSQGYLNSAHRPQCGNCQNLSQNIRFDMPRCGLGDFPVGLSCWCCEYFPKAIETAQP